jgi:hypothetical protein
MGEVIDNLQKAGEKPKAIFLYRDPLSRAVSIFNEWKRKGLTSSPNVIRDIAAASVKEGGLWWESYYDNVFYMRNYKLMESYFDDLLLVNYRCFAESPGAVFSVVSDFVGVPITKTIEYTPHNSSAEAKFDFRFGWSRRLARYVPKGLRHSFHLYWNGLSDRADRKSIAGLTGSLPDSVNEYNEFINYIGAQDIVFRGQEGRRRHDASGGTPLELVKKSF